VLPLHTDTCLPYATPLLHPCWIHPTFRSIWIAISVLILMIYTGADIGDTDNYNLSIDRQSGTCVSLINRCAVRARVGSQLQGVGRTMAYSWRI
jgi:hypothetical protein